jgi:hypothetical protein
MDSLNLIGGGSRGEAHHVYFRARLKRDPTKKENFLTLMKILQPSHLTTYFGISIEPGSALSVEPASRVTLELQKALGK